LGRAYALLLASRGAKVVVNDLGKRQSKRRGEGWAEEGGLQGHSGNENDRKLE